MRAILPAFLCLHSFVLTALAADAPRPNILIIFTDDQGYGDLGCYDLKTAKTLHLDRLAAEGTRFTSFYAQPVCGPSRSALLTGRYPSRSGGWSMPATEITFAELMQKSGYATACVGKWDVSSRKAIPERMPLQKGFDYYFGPLGANDGGNVILHENNTLLGEDKDLASLSRRYTDKSIAWLKQQRESAKEKPFLLYLCHTMMHTVINASPEFRDKTGNGLYADTLQELDHECGRLLKALDDLGLRERTLVIFTTDNGAWNNDIARQNAKNVKHVAWSKGPQISVGSNAPLREGKGSDYEGGVRVSCVARWPGKVPAGRVNDAIFATLDFMPTFASLAGFQPPQDRVLDGFDQTDLLLGKSEAGSRDHYFYHSGTHGVRQGSWKLLKAGRWPRNYGNRYPADRGSNDVELYNLDTDISETKNLAAEHPDIVARLGALKLPDEKPAGPKHGGFEPGGRTKAGKAKVALALAESSAGKAATTFSKPNLVVILADDLGYGDVGCFGAKDIRTPNLDRMAAEGLKLTSFYAQPICGPSRAALMTGCYPIRIGEVANGKHGHTLPHPKEVFMAEMLRDAGYRTGIVGKWHLGMSAGCDPLSQGFRHAYFTPAFNGATKHIPPGHKVPFLRNPGEVVRTITNQAEMDTLTADCTREAMEFIRSSKDKPFFLYLAYHMPHVPLGASEKFRGRSQRGLYGDVIEELDDAVGQLLAELKAQSLDDSTLIVFTSDNGPWTDKQIGDHGGSPGPFRGAKMTTWEGGWRVPCIVRWPGKVRAGETSDGITSTLDVLPTFAKMASGKVASALAGSESPDAAEAATTLDGLDLTAFLTTSGATSPRETFLYHNGSRLTAVRHKDWKLVFARPAGGEMPYMPGFITGHVEALPETALYHLRNDPAESKNLVAERPAVVKLLTKLADESRADLGDFTGPGSGTRLFDEGVRWPAFPNRPGAKQKTKTAK